MASTPAGTIESGGGQARLAPGLTRILASDGRIVVEADEPEALAGLEIRQGRTPLVLTSDIAPAPSFALARITPDDVRRTTALGLGGAAPCVSCNLVPEWTVANGQTLFIRIDDAGPDRHFALCFGGRPTLKIDGRAHVFRGLVAAPLVHGQLIAVVTDTEGAVEGTFSAPIARTARGGSDPADHAAIEIRIPAGAEARHVALTCLCHAFEPSEEPPYVFVSDPALEVQGEDAPEALVWQAPAAGDGSGADGSPARLGAPIDPNRGTEPLTVRAGGRSVTLPAPPAPVLTGRLEAGRVYRVTGDRAGPYTLYVDGRFAARLFVTRQETGFMLPAHLLDGGVHHLAIRDAHGLFTLHQDYVALDAVLTPEAVLQRESRRPFPSGLSRRAGHRYRALAAALEAGPAPEEALQLAHAHRVLETGYEALQAGDVRPLAFPQVESPEISVVMPVHERFAMTYHALAALLLARNAVPFELIVVDDGSHDARMRDLQALLPGARVLRRAAAGGFIKACNAGVAAARGAYVALLNNDTEVTLGWLDALLAPFSAFERVGLTGARLLNADGTLQEAGGIVWRSGTPWNYGRGENPADPRFGYVRDVDYVSGAALMMPRALWDAVGGLSAYLEPMYYEDTDLAFKVREAGYRTLLAPAATVFHFEGGTSGRDESRGLKAYQPVNAPKFKRRWAAAFREAGEEGVAPDREKDRAIVGRVMVIDHATPRPDRDAGSYAAVEEMRLIQALGFKVTFVPENLAHMGAYTKALEAMGVEVVTAPFAASLEEVIRSRGAETDAFYLVRYHVAERCIPVVRAHAPQAKVLFMNADLHFLRELRASLLNGAGEAEMEAVRTTREAEMAVMRAADVTLSYSEVEHAVITAQTLGAVTVRRAPWVVRVRNDVPRFRLRRGLAFLGSYRHPPNEEAVRWFCAEVMPLLRRKRPDLRLHLYGSDMPESVASLAGADVIAHGHAETVEAVHDAHRIFVAPLLSGAGVKGKVLGALAGGIPCVLSPIAAEGLGLRDGHDCRIVQGPEGWAEAIAELDADARLWRRLSRNAQAFMAAHYGPDTGLALMREAFQAADIYYTR